MVSTSSYLKKSFLFKKKIFCHEIYIKSVSILIYDSPRYLTVVRRVSKNCHIMFEDKKKGVHAYQ